MIALRNIIALILVVFLLSAVSAINISVDSPIPQGVGWSFTLNLDSLNEVDSAKVLVDGSVAMEVFDFAGTIYVNEESISSKVMDYSVVGENLTVSYSSMGEGEVEVAIKTYNGEDEQDSYEKTVEFFIPLDQRTKEELEGQINVLEVNINNQADTVAELEINLASKDNEIQALKSDNASLLNSINSMQTTIETLESEGVSTDEQLSVLKSDLNVILTEREEAIRNNPVNAMFAFNEETNGLASGAVVVLILLVIVAVVLRTGGGSIYSGMPSLPEISNPFKKDDSESDSAYEQTEEDTMDEQADDMFKGKWAFMDEESKE